MPDLVLASTSNYRRELLARFGVPFQCVAPEVDENAVRQKTKDPIALARELAKAKAAAVRKKHQTAVVIGCDQVCALGDEVLGKPGSEDAAVAQLKRLQGKEHALVTAVAVLHGKGAEEFVDVTMLRMRELDSKEIRRYVDQDKPLDCAGSYKIEQAGIALFERITGEDHTAVVGLPLLRLGAALRKCGFLIP